MRIFGIIFQENQIIKKTYEKVLALLLSWQIFTMFITMFFAAILKSSLMHKNLEKPTRSINEMIDKDMIVHTAQASLNFYELPDNQHISIYKRLALQARKKSSVFELPL